MPATARTAVALLLLAGCLLALAPSCHAHGFLLNPRSRVLARGRAEWEAAGGNGLGSPHRTYVNSRGQAVLLNDQADVCGDPHQDVGNMGMAGIVTNPQATYTAGSTISVTIRLRTNHGGWLGIRICPNTRSGPSQACFDRNTLTNADTGYQRWWLRSNSYDYVTRWRLPSGVTCDGGCVMQMTYRTANSCVDSCSVQECGSSYAARRNPITGQCMNGACSLDQCGGAARTEIFRDCADIRITGSRGLLEISDDSSNATVTTNDRVPRHLRA